MKIFRFTALALLLLPLTAASQYYQGRDWDRSQGPNSSFRLNDVARRLSNNANILWNMVRYRREFREPENRYVYSAIRDFAASARDYRANPSDWRARRLVDEAQDINRLVNRANLPFDFRNRWFATEDQVSFLSRYYGIPFDWDRNLARAEPYYDQGAYQSGIFRWRGRVDGSDIIYLRGSQVTINHLNAQPITSSSFDLPSPLPINPVDVQLTKIQGRGRVQIVQQPSPGNDFTAGVLIEDNQPGSDWYEFELHW
jgi:hypothetical protein